MKFATASQAARFLNVATPTYLSHENGTRKISAEWADRYADAFGISPTWLLYNRGAPDEDNTFVRPVASASPAQRNPARMQSPNPLLAIFEVNYAADGALRPLPGVRNADAPAWLPTVSAANGFLPELVYVPYPERESRRIVQIGGMESWQTADGQVVPVLFGLDDYIRVPPDMLSCDMAFAVRLRNADLIESASGIDRAIVDPTDRVPFRAAYYFILINQKASIVYIIPDEMDQTNYPNKVWIYETRFEDPKDWDLEKIFVIGRVISMIMNMSEQLKANFVKPLELVQARREALPGRPGPARLTRGAVRQT
jgi:hypothetical protein